MMGLALTMKKMLLGRAFTTDKGRIVTFGRISWIMFPARAMAVMLQNMGKELGNEYLYKIGYMTGKDFGNEISEALGFSVKVGKVIQQAVLSLTEFTGFGVVKIVKWKVEKNGHHNITIHVNHNPVVEHSKNLYRSRSMACDFFRGVFSANTEVETYAKNVKFIEKKCVCKGGQFCEWESRW
jgi:predicted hydrocarbon binding protein